MTTTDLPALAPSPPVPVPREAAGSSSWPAAIAAALRDDSQPALVYQPIVDLRRGVVCGYEALSRFSGPPHAPPDQWFAAADRLGVGAELEARVVRAALAVRDTLPEDCFLTVNVSPHLLGQPALIDCLAAARDLRGLVLELTEHVPVDDQAGLVALLGQLRAAGATVALDDAGSGYAGLQQMALVRPELVKIDRALVDHADRDEVKLALAELLGTYAGRLDAVVLAEGIERVEELEAFARLGVPLAQGWLFGRPGPAWPTLPLEQSERIQALSRDQRQVDRVAALLERTETVHEDDLDAAATRFRDDPTLEVAVVLDRHGRAVCLLRRQLRADDAQDIQVVSVTMRAVADAGLAEVASRAMTRPAAARFDPVICSDAYGSFLGLVRPERMMLRLAELASAADAAPSRGGLSVRRTSTPTPQGAR